ncbi:hypothetical protein AC579_7675 [Pseudocercospora musae]|uniref:Uncharacterized protein n=1 Tax=Pseudocercospora musae TaxID=113226 RepID=A0A139GT52_9PEZI|nr:hypothetical protein AC579_7675 [Pseudocercospora musae]
MAASFSMDESHEAREAKLIEWERALKRRESAIEYANQREELAEERLEDVRKREEALKKGQRELVQRQRKLSDGWKAWEAAMEQEKSNDIDQPLHIWLRQYVRILSQWREHATSVLDDYRGELVLASRSNTHIARSLLQEVKLFHDYILAEESMPGLTLADELRGRSITSTTDGVPSST